MLKTLNFCALLLSVAWFYFKPDWEPLISSLVLLGAFISQEAYPRFKKAKRHDIELANAFLNEFSSSSDSAYFLKEHNVGNPFHDRCLNEIESFIRKS